MSKENSSETNQLAEDDYEYVAEPPDGGFGWVIAIAAMLCNLVCDGTLFAFGVMKTYLQAHFECSDTAILMVGSVPCGVYLLVGPIVSGLANRYGCRIIIIIGSIGASICMFASTLSTNVWMMIIIYGIFGGIFLGMVYLPSVVMVSFYFDKKRVIANGLVTAGTGIGALSFSPLANYLMDAYGWKIGMYVFAAIMLSCILFGAIMIPLKPKRIPIKRDLVETQFVANDETDSGVISSNDIAKLKSINHALDLPVQSNRVRTISSSSQTSTGARDHYLGVPDPENASRPLYKKDAFFMGSKQQLHHQSLSSLRGNPYMASAMNIPAAVDESKKKQSALRAFADILSAMTDFSILKNRQMLLICIGNIFSMLGYYLPILCLASFAIEDNGVSKANAALLSTVFGGFNTLGRFAGGPIAMIPGLSALRVHNAFLYLAGIATALAAYAYNFQTCAIYAAFCGFMIAPHMSLLPSVICDCVGLERYTTAFGILFLFRGVTSIIGPPAAGFIKDYTKRYDVAFALGGAMIVIAAFFHIVIAAVEPERLINEESEEEEENLKIINV